MDVGVVSFLKEHNDAELLANGKIRCATTLHEIPARLELLQQHWSGKAYNVRKAVNEYDFKQHEPWILPHKKNQHLLWCTITGRPISKQPKTVAGHVNGKKFRRLLAEALAKAGASAVQVEDGDIGKEDGTSEGGDESDNETGWEQEGCFWEEGGDIEEGVDEHEKEPNPPRKLKLGRNSDLKKSAKRFKADGDAAAQQKRHGSKTVVRGGKQASSQSVKPRKVGLPKLHHPTAELDGPLAKRKVGPKKQHGVASNSAVTPGTPHNSGSRKRKVITGERPPTKRNR